MTHNFQCQGTSDWTTSKLAHGVSRLSGFHTWSRPDSQPLCPFFTHPCCTSVLCHLGGRIRTGSHAHGGAAQVSLWEEHSLRELIYNVFHFILFLFKSVHPSEGIFHFFPPWFWLIWFSFVVANTQMHNEKLCNPKPVKCCHSHFLFFFQDSLGCQAVYVTATDPKFYDRQSKKRRQNQKCHFITQTVFSNVICITYSMSMYICINTQTNTHTEHIKVWFGLFYQNYNQVEARTPKILFALHTQTKCGFSRDLWRASNHVMFFFPFSFTWHLIGRSTRFDWNPLMWQTSCFFVNALVQKKLFPLCYHSWKCPPTTHFWMSCFSLHCHLLISIHSLASRAHYEQQFSCLGSLFHIWTAGRHLWFYD